MKGRDMDAAEQPCGGCGKPLLRENAWMEDGCPCNTPAGVNNLNLYRWRLLHELQQEQSHALSAERAAREAAQRERDTLHEQVGETISCEHVRQGDSTVTRLHFCHACRDLTKQAYLAARGSHEA